MLVVWLRQPCLAYWGHGNFLFPSGQWHLHFESCNQSKKLTELVGWIILNLLLLWYLVFVLFHFEFTNCIGPTMEYQQILYLIIMKYLCTWDYSVVHIKVSMYNWQKSLDFLSKLLSKINKKDWLPSWRKNQEKNRTVHFELASDSFTNFEVIMRWDRNILMSNT